MKAKWQNFNGVAWDASDLISCKQAVLILAREGVCDEVLLSLNFGNLDVAAVLEEDR